VVSIRKGKFVPKWELRNKITPRWWKASVEDPFESDHDLGNVITKAGFDRMNKEMLRANEIFTNEKEEVGEKMRQLWKSLEKQEEEKIKKPVWMGKKKNEGRGKGKGKGKK
jgi:hypothetical protein